MILEVIFDLETKKLFADIEGHDPSKLGVSLVSAYRRELDASLKEVKGKMWSFWEKDLAALWKWFEEADRIIAFNSFKFDLQVLQPLAPFRLTKLPHLDIFAHVSNALGRRVSLAVLARDTLGVEKSDNGINAVKYWNEGSRESLERLRRYCERDVEITRDLYDYGRQHRHLKLTDHWNNPRAIPVDFSYPKTMKTSEKQIGLF